MTVDCGFTNFKYSGSLAGQRLTEYFQTLQNWLNQICEALVWKPWEVSWSMKKPSNRVRCFSFFPACSQTERCGKIESEVDIHSTFSQTARQSVQLFQKSILSFCQNVFPTVQMTWMGPRKKTFFTFLRYIFSVNPLRFSQLEFTLKKFASLQWNICPNCWTVHISHMLSAILIQSA